MKKDRCLKCNEYEFVQEHHILPTSTFGENDEKVKLCSNCHTEYHQFLGSKGLKNQHVKFHLEKYYKWLYGLGVLAILIWLVL